MSDLPDDRGDVEVVVSVIVANYNGEKFIADAIRSVCDQSLRRIEIIVSDDASTDSSIQIVRTRFADDSRVRIIESSVNRGPAAARNRALDVVRGRWIAIMDSDDLMHPDRLQMMVEAGSRSGADIIADDLLLFDSNRKTAPHALLTGRWGRAEQWVKPEDYVGLNNFYGSGPALGYLKPIFRASVIAAHCIRYDERLRIAEDYNFVFRLLMAEARFRTIPAIGYFYRRHSGSISHRLNPSVLTRILEVERGWTDKWPSRSLTPLLRSRERSIRRAIAFERLVEAIKGRQVARALMIAAGSPGAAALLRLPVKEFVARRLARPEPPGSARPQICLLSRQRITGRTNGSSRYLLEIAEFLRGQGFDIHLRVPSPTTMGRWPFLQLSQDMAVFKTIKIRGTIRLGRYIIARDPMVALNGLFGMLDRVLARTGLLLRPLSRPAPYAIAQALTREDQLFIATEAPPIADVQIADYCFLTEAYPYVLRPDARRVVIMHDLFSSRSGQFSKLNASDSVVSLPLEEEVRMLGRAETIVAIQRDEAAVLQRKLPGHEVLVVPMAAVPVSKSQTGSSESILFVGSSAAPNVDGIRWFLDECWPVIHQRRPEVVLQIAGSVCNALPAMPSGTKALNVVEDLDQLYAEAAVVISPLRAGSGLKIKLIEGLSKGKAMVVTTTTMQGVGDILGTCALVEDSAAGFAAMVIKLLDDVEMRGELGEQGIAAISKHFSPGQVYGVIASALQRPRAASARRIGIHHGDGR